MNLGSANVTIRQRGVLEVFDLAFVVIRTLGRRVYWRLALFSVVPAWLLCVVGQYGLQLPWPWVWLLAIALSSILQGPFTLAAGQLMFELDVPAHVPLQSFWGRLAPFLFAWGASRLLIVLAAATVLLLPSVWSRMLFVHEVSLLEGASGRQSLRRASAFVRFDGSSTFATLLLHVLMIGMMVVWAEMIGWGVVTWLLQLGEPYGSLWTEGGSPYALAGLFASVPLIATARYLSYVDGRTRRDGWDVQVRFQAIAVGAKGQHSWS